jgi:hypothetical protein
MTVVGGSTAYAAVAVDTAAASAVLATSPSDIALAGASDTDLIRMSSRCLSLAGMTYCLHYGWGTPPQYLAGSADEAASAPATRGDTTLLSAVRQWSKKSFADRVSAEQAELSQAMAAEGKMLLLDHAILGAPLPSDFVTRFPDLAAMSSKIAKMSTPAGKSAGSGGVATPNGATICDSGTNFGCAYTAVAYGHMEKQDQTYNCGAASMQAIAWNDPKASNQKTQGQWESILGTTADGTNVTALKNSINANTHWDDPDYAGPYVVVSIASWSVNNFRNLFVNHLGGLRAPVQLHPVLNTSTSTYYRGTTGGHYDVAIGYDYSVYDQVLLYEPAGGKKQANIFPWLTALEDTTHIRLAQLANSNNRNIVY